jgi:hypothetical protein
MSDELYGLTADQVARVGKIVGGIERQPPPPARNKSATNAPPATFWAELTAEDHAHPGNYKWKMVKIDDRTFVDADPAVDSGDNFSALEPTLHSGLIGKRVELMYYGLDSTATPRYIIQATPTYGMVLVWLTSKMPSYGWYNGVMLKGSNVNDAATYLDAFHNKSGGNLSVGQSCLVMNLDENYSPTNHLSTNDFGDARSYSGKMRFHLGLIIGISNEGPPRPIVAISAHQINPCAVQITDGVIDPGGNYRGAYKGKLLEGRGSGYPPNMRVATNKVDVINLFELPMPLASLSPRLKTDGTFYVHGVFMGGYSPAGTGAVHICYPVAADSPGTSPSVTTTETADADYDINEANMLNHLKADVTAMNTFVVNMYTSLKNAGYIK